MNTRAINSVFPVVVMLALAIQASADPALNYDLELKDATDITAPTNSTTNWHSSDIKIGADFGDASIPDIVRRGVLNPVYAKFYINGVMAHTVPSGTVKLRFHYRDAMIGEAPSGLPAPGAPGNDWNLIDELNVTHGGSGDPPFVMTNWWPEDYPSVTPRYVDWSAPATGNHFHIRAEAIYPIASGFVDDAPANNVAISLYESILGTREVDLVIVHDVSGSMLSYMYAGDTYLDHAKSNAQTFLFSMNGSDRFAVVAFGGCLPGGVADIWGTPVPPLKEATWPNKLMAASSIATNVTVPNFGCLTPMGVGMERAIQILTSVPADPTRKRAILLLTDGYENNGTPRACPNTDPVGPCLGGTILSDLQSNGIRVFSVALGTSAGTDCLECLANGTGGQWYASPDPGITLAQAYLDMQQTYSADDLYRADVGTTGGGDDSYQTHFEGLDDTLYFILKSDNLNTEINLKIRPPGGSWQIPSSLPNARVVKGQGYVVVRAEKPAAGSWGYQVIGEEKRDYLVAVRSDRVGVQLFLGVKSNERVGSPIFIKAHLKDQGKPITSSGLTAMVQVPTDSSLDAILRIKARDFIREFKKSPVDPVQVRKNPDMSPRALFVRRITDGQQQTLVKTRTVKVPLKWGQDGSYTGVLKEPTQVAGEYKVTVQLKDERADRVQSMSVRLHPGLVDYQKSFAELLVLEKGSSDRPSWVARVYPTDKFGNAITDVRLLRDLKIVVRGAELVKKPLIAFDSTFEQRLYVPSNRAPELQSVSIGGKEIRIKKVGMKK